jgi:hypothetical protein
MTHLPTLERWAALLRPLFPPHAELELKPGSSQVRALWPPAHAVEIFIAPNAVSNYRSAQSDVQARADTNLRDFVQENLARLRPGHEGAFRIVVASIDFVPLH